MTKQNQKRILRLMLFTGTAISLFFVPWVLVFAWIQPIPSTVEKQMKQASKLGLTYMMVYVDVAGQAPSFFASGEHNRERQIPAYPDALFKMASIGKLYTATAIAKMTHDGLLSLDQPLTDFFPELEGRIQYADRITVKMLVQHRSGIPNYTDTEGYWESEKESDQENLDLVLDQPADFEPDQGYAYSNTNYLLLSRIMDKVLGYPHFPYIQERILDRLNLKRTFASVGSAPFDSIMSGYHKGYPHDLKSSEMGYVASAEDIGIFVRALNDGSLFDGTEQDIYASIYEYEHGGLVPGYQSKAKYHPDMDAVIVQFSGPTHPKLYNWNLAGITYNRIVRIVRRQNRE